MGLFGIVRSVVERASPLSTSPCRHPRLTGRHRACRDVASARTIDRQFESCCGSDRTSGRPSPLSLLSGISTATLYHYIHTYYILYIISGRLTLHWCQKWDVNHSWLGPVLNLGLLSLDVSNFPGLSGGGGTMDGEEDSSYMLVFSCQSWGVQPSLGTSCWAAV